MKIGLQLWTGFGTLHIFFSSFNSFKIIIRVHSDSGGHRDFELKKFFFSFL